MKTGLWIPFGKTNFMTNTQSALRNTNTEEGRIEILKKLKYFVRYPVKWLRKESNQGEDPRDGTGIPTLIRGVYYKK